MCRMLDADDGLVAALILELKELRGCTVVRSFEALPKGASSIRRCIQADATYTFDSAGLPRYHKALAQGDSNMESNTLIQN